MRLGRLDNNSYNYYYYNKIQNSKNITSVQNYPRNINDQKNKEPKGLINESLNCYTNSLLQCLYYIREFRNFFINHRKDFSKNQQVCIALSEVMYKLKYAKEKYFEATKFLEIIEKKNKLFSNHRGGDAKDLFFNLIDFLLNEMLIDNSDTISISSGQSILSGVNNNDKKKSFKEAKKEIDFNNIINSLFIGFYEIIYKCKNSTFNKIKEVYSFNTDSFILFELEAISDYFQNTNLTLDDCFEYNFNRRYNSSFYCSLCRKEEKNMCEEKIYEPPKILVLILDRGKGKKFKGKVEIKINLDLESFIDDEDNEDESEISFKYNLIGLIIHSGPSSASGHYTACCQIDNGKFFHFNDEYTQEININKMIIKDEPYLLFYRREENFTIE